MNAVPALIRAFFAQRVSRGDAALSSRGFVPSLEVLLKAVQLSWYDAWQVHPAPGRSIRSPPHVCFLRSLAACFKLQLHSSYARPEPNPSPTNAGHALRLNNNTEKTMPKPRPMVDLTRRFDKHRSHCESSVRTLHGPYASLECRSTFSLRSASLTGRATALGEATCESGMVDMNW